MRQAHGRPLGIWLLLILAATAHASSVQYLYAVQQGAGPIPPPSRYLRSDLLSLQDDGFLELILPFWFPYYPPAIHQRILVSSNGYVQFNKTGSCCSSRSACVFMVPSSTGRGGCTLDNSFHSIIAPSLCDLNPARTASDGTTGVFYGVTASNLTVLWRDLRIHSHSDLPSPPFTFQLTLDSTGSIDMRWFAVSDPEHVVQTATYAAWLVGIRRPLWGDPFSPFTAQWNTTQHGVYPPRSAVRSGRRMSLCPMSTSFCLATPFLSETGGEPVLLAADTLACLTHPDFSFFCRFHPTSVPSSPPMDIPATFNSSLSALQCSSPSLPAGSAAMLDIYYVIEDADEGSLSQPLHIQEAPLYVQFVGNDSSAVRNGSVAWQRALCSQCGEHSGLDAVCWRDCAGTWLGEARLDDCRVCSGGSTRRPFNADKNCQGVCFGPTIINETLCDCPPHLVFPSPNVSSFDSCSLGIQGPLQDINSVLADTVDYRAVVVTLSFATVLATVILGYRQRCWRHRSHRYGGEDQPAPLALADMSPLPQPQPEM